MAQSINSRSYKVNNAAKDETVCLTADGKVSLAQLLANDPGSAVFQADLFKVPGVSYDAVTQTFTVTDPSVKSFEYTVRMANGTFSKAVATIGSTYELSDAELLKNFSFEEDPITNGGPYQSFTEVQDWDTNAGSAALEVVSAGYSGIGIGGHWLDTQATPGGVDIQQSVDLATGRQAQLSISVATQDIDGLLTDPNATLSLYWNGKEVESIKASDLAKSETFQTFTVTVTGQDGMDTVRLADSANTNVGFAVDYVSLRAYEWMCA